MGYDAFYCMTYETPRMTSLKPATTLEKIAGHTLTEATMTAIATLSGTPLAALLPVLSNTLANGRHKARVEAALAEVDSTLNKHAEALAKLSDSQYKLINEIVLALLHTTHTEKIEYLKRAIGNSLTQDVFQPQEAVVLSRVLRDISAEEADFLVNNFQYDRVWISDTDNLAPSLRVVHPGLNDELVVSGLVSLGLLLSAEATRGPGNQLRFSPIVAKLLVLLK